MKSSFYNQVSGSSPDLVCLRSRGQFGGLAGPYLIPNPHAHRTYANLAALVDTQQVCPKVSNFVLGGGLPNF